MTEDAPSSKKAAPPPAQPDSLDGLPPGLTFGTPTLHMSTSMWVMWWTIALGHAEGAASARQEILDAQAAGDRPRRFAALGREVEASLQAVCCAVFACEALVINWTALVMERATVDGWYDKKDRTPIGSRRNQVFKRVHGPTAGDELDSAWAPLFDLRHNVVHHLEVMAVPGPHPSGIGGVSAISQQFTVEQAHAAVDLLARVTVEAMATNKTTVKSWLNEHRPVLDLLESGRRPD